MTAEQSGSIGSSDVKKEEDIIKQILERIKKFNENKISEQITDYIPKLIVGFVSMTLLLLTYQINSISGYFGSGLGVPSHNVGIYTAKLISYRSFLMMIGFAFEYLINYICTLVSKENDYALSITRKVISLFFFYLLLATRGCLLFSTFLTNNLSYRVYILLSLEAIPAGACQMSLFLLIPQFIFITFLSIHLLAFIFFLSQFAFDLFLSNKPLIMLKIQFFMSLFVTIIAFGLWAFYLFYYYDKDPKSYKDELYKQTNNIKKANSIYLNLKEVEKKAKDIFEKIRKESKDTLYTKDITNELNESKPIISDILILNNVFLTLMKDCFNSINQYKTNLEKHYNEIKEKPALDKNKDENKFHSQKSKYYNDNFVEKVNKLKTTFDSYDNKVKFTDLSNNLTQLENEINIILKVFNNGGTDNSFEFISEIKKIHDKISKLDYERGKITFDLTRPTKDGDPFSKKNIEVEQAEKEFDDKINSFIKSITQYEIKLEKIKPDLEKITKLHDGTMKILFEKSDHILFCYIMIGLACFFRDFLYPPIIPHALLIEYEAQKILLLGIVLQLFFCFPVFILDEILNIFALLIDRYFIYFWTLVGPPLIVLIFTFLAIHTKIRFFHVITESSGRVFTLSLFLIPFYTLMESVSYACLLHYVFYQLGFSHQNLLFLLFHQLLEMFCTYIFSKLSAGYNHARVRLGHCLPTYTTNYEMNFWQELWSMVKWTLQYTFKDILFFFSTNIRQYL